ncbi:MAG: LysE/ArgO family amino acid transporter [Cardiobacteriaceae bacterium]|nr:LysE/ArgO family amino acid transporter [Cardiobacteriaceae bacterium]
MQAFLSGFMLSAALIIAIGAQNAFVLKQGLRREHVGLVVALCVLCDAVLIACGVFGLAALLDGKPRATALLALAGGIFLLVYAARSARSAWRGDSQLGVSEAGSARHAAWPVALTTLALTLLNPHVYIDTVMLIGGAAAPLPQQGKWHFWLGAATASALWFASLGYGVRFLLPLFRRRRTWQLLDGAIALMMLYLSAGLLKDAWVLLAGK